MLTKTSLTAIRALMYVARHGEGRCLSPRTIAAELHESPTYLAKVTRELVKARILRVEMGVKGGVALSKPPAHITMLAIVEACQGAIVGAYCRQGCDLEEVCAYHRAAQELHDAISRVLERWTLEKLLKKPTPPFNGKNQIPCVILSILSPSVFQAAPNRIK